MSFNLPTISALGTSWWIEVFDDVDEKRRTVIHDDCAAFLYTFENNYSRFLPDSYISQLNSTGILTTPTEEFQMLLTVGREQFARTDGVFNLMVGSKLVETGYDANYSFIPQATTATIPDPRDVLHISPNGITLDYGQVDIGGFGKGYAIDAIVTLLREKHNLKYFLVNGGGDMFGTSDHDEPITIYLEHPTMPSTYLTTTTLLNQGFAASSPHKRTWQYNGTTYTHIIDTLTKGNAPLTRPNATFIKAATACDADIFATVALLVTPETLATLAEKAGLGVACFFLSDSSLSQNKVFI